MKKIHDLTFSAQELLLAFYPASKGRMVFSGLLHEIDCAQCRASDWARLYKVQAHSAAPAAPTTYGADR